MRESDSSSGSSSGGSSSSGDDEEEKKEYNPIQRYQDEKPLVIKKDQILKNRIVPDQNKN